MPPQVARHWVLRWRKQWPCRVDDSDDFEYRYYALRWTIHEIEILGGVYVGESFAVHVGP